MCGCESWEIVFASRSKRCRISSLAERWPGSTLTATVRSSRVSRARYTSPIPPAPTDARISYGPSLVPACISVSIRPRGSVLEPLRPVHDHRGRRSAVGDALHGRQEPAVGGYVESPPALAGEREERTRFSDLERWGSPDGRGEEAPVGRGEEDLLAVPAPTEQGRTGSRHASPFRVLAKRLHVRLLPARLVGEVSDPAAVGRDAADLLLRFPDDDRRRGGACSRQRQHPEAEPGLARLGKEEVLAVRRHVHGFLEGAGRQQQFLGSSGEIPPDQLRERLADGRVDKAL